jgi:carboxyl-terminal processing protease
MPRQNLLVLVAVSLVALVCYRQADSAHRSEHGRMFDTFSEVLREVDENYLRKVENRQLFEGAMQGMMSALDPYSAYIGPSHYAEFVATLEQKFGGIGIEVAVEPGSGALTVTTPLADSPAYLQGVRAGDQVLKIDGESTKGLALDDVVGRLRGRKGSVTLTVLHKGETQPLEITIPRAVIPMPSVLGDTRDADNHWDFFLPGEDRIGYVRLTNFGENTLEELEAALVWLSERHVRGLILDLRNNRGGVFDQAISVCDLFVREGRIVSTRGRDGLELKSWEATGKAPYAALSLVVLVNQQTASAAEIVAACLQDHDRATIVGQRTWGKGTVQNVVLLEGGQSLLKLTTASYWRPSGQDIHRYENEKDQQSWGVQPNPGFEVKLTDQEASDVNRRRHDRDVIRPQADAADQKATSTETSNPADPQLEKAIAAIHGLLAK